MSLKTLYYILFILVMIGAASGGIAVLFRPTANPGIEIVLPTPTPTPELKVYISGEVGEPGVYTLKEGARVEDAVAAAGGPSAEADLSLVNMAQRVKDEDHFHIPKVGETPPVIPRVEEAQENDKIDINTAPVSLLITLDGIGETLAQRIVEYRETHGPFGSTAEIMKVFGIGAGTYEKIRDTITVSELTP